MFLSIFNETEEKKNIIIHRRLYECDDMTITQDDNGYIFSLDPESPSKNRAVVVNGDTPRRIFVMSDQGKTIERFYWKINK